MITVDFETEAIVGNPIVDPPRAVGVAVWIDGMEPFYLAWGHPTENNCSYEHAHLYLKKLRDSGEDLLFHNAPFDLSVLDDSFCNARWSWLDQSWKRIHDTLYLVFLADPYAQTFSLKPSADRYLAMPPTEQDELKAWIVANVPGANDKNFGAFIARAPGDLVGRYAIGDVVRTRELFRVLHASIKENGMEAAYDRERRLMPTLMWGTRTGIRLDRHTLEHHESVYTEALSRSQESLVDLLGGNPAVLDSDSLLADALDAAGAVDEWVYTPTGKRSMAKGNLRITHPEIRMYMEYSGKLETCLQTFMRPWLEKSERDGRLHPNWNQVRQSRSNDRDSKGTKTGRLSSDDPNFQNVPTEFTDLFGNPIPSPPGLPPLPMLRRYCLPEEGYLWLKRDYSGQELRILAHFEDGQLAEAYRGNPNLDVHQMARELIKEIIGLLYARKDIKITGFSLIYGSGVTGLSQQLGQPYGEAYKIKSAYLAVLPDVRDLMDDVKRRGEAGGSIRTWGGRVYFAEPSKVIRDKKTGIEQLRNFAYKLLNYLIQGSAADQTKHAINSWADHATWESRFLATVHDEIDICAPKDDWRRHMETLRVNMEQDLLDVPVLSDGFVGENWQDIVEESKYETAA